MCLKTIEIEPSVAKKDIIVYKVLYKNKNQIVSPCKRFPYILKKLYQTDFGITIGISNDTLLFINEGFHSYRYKNYAARLYFNVYKCVIPKGSQYYISIDRQEIVSNQIIIKRKLWFNKF